MMQDIINELAEKTVKGMNDFVGEQLRACGYSAEYVREHQYDFITVHMLEDPVRECTESYTVYVPEERVLFGIRRYTILDDSGEYGAKLTIRHERIEPEEATESVLEEVRRCARDAKARAEERDRA